MWPFAIVDGKRTHISEANRGTRGICPVCGEALVARKGAYRCEHWWHVNGRQCDLWYESRGPWHRYWQDMFPSDCQEVIVECDGIKHIADVKTKKGIVVEMQWSAISTEQIAAREKFYDKMLWIVGMCRLVGGQRLKERFDDADISRVRKQCRMHVLSACDLPRSIQWLDCSWPVFFDFDGTFDKPESNGNLYYLMPKRKDDDFDRYCIEVPRMELIEALRVGRAHDLFQELKDFRDGHERWLQEERERAIIRARADELKGRAKIEARERDRAEPFRGCGDSFPSEVAFANRKFHLPPRCAVTMGWVEGYLVSRGFITEWITRLPEKSFAPYGRIAIHFAEDYSLDEYKVDMAKAKEMGLAEEVLPYDKLEMYRDKIVACVDYLIKHEDSDIAFTFRYQNLFYRPSAKACAWHRSSVEIWDLPSRTQEYLGQVDEFSRRIEI